MQQSQAEGKAQQGKKTMKGSVRRTQPTQGGVCNTKKNKAGADVGGGRGK